jgi:predicted metal-dependent phosphotriesterase family hydrolase
MCDHLEAAEKALDRRTLIVKTAGAVAAAGLAGRLLLPDHASPATRGPAGAGAGTVLQTVTGPLRPKKIGWALGHEHFFVDFLGPTDPGYMDVDWADVTGACVSSAMELRAQGVDLFVDWTNIGVGRNALLLRNISRQTGMAIVCATGIYKSLTPPQLADSSVAAIARHFYNELAKGIDGTPVRAGWIKIATTESGPTPSDTKNHRAAARAGKRAGCTISLHSPHAEVTNAVVRTLESEGFDLSRFVWGHSQPSSVEDHKAMAARGAMVQYDAISAESDPFFHGPTDDESMLDRIEEMVKAGYGDRVIVSADASVFVNPAVFQYDRDNTYVFRTFLPKLEERIGKPAARTVLRDNVIKAFRRGSNVP